MINPIAIFTFNRLEHLKELINSLNKNLELKDSEVYFFSDGPKDDQRSIQEVNEVRSYIENIDIGKKKILQYQESNIGLAKNIVNGINYIFDNSQYESIIVLEDDLIVANNFLSFMNHALYNYKDDPKVFHVSGWSYTNHSKSDEVRFLKMMNCWGWGTWKNKFIKYRKEPREIYHELSSSETLRKEFNLDGVFPFDSHLKKNITGELNTWAIFWYYAMFKENGYEALPPYSLVSNNGLDGSGTNSVIRKKFNQTNMVEVKDIIFREFHEDKEYRELVKAFYKKQYNLKNKIITYLQNKLNSI